MPPRLTVDDYHILAKTRGFKWLGSEVPNNSTKTNWECHRGHSWAANYSNISKGQNCPYCTRERVSESLRLSSSCYHDLARAKGLTWLGPEVRNVRTKTCWRCENGHDLELDYLTVVGGNGCHVCGLQARTEATPHVAPHEIVRAFKGRSSRILREEFPHLLKLPSLWTHSYFCRTAGNVSAAVIERYIEAQRET